MKKTTLFLIFGLILLAGMGVVIAAGGDYMDYLTKGFADTLYCQVKGDCVLNSLNVTNITVISISQLNVTTILGEHWVNETGDDVTGDINMIIGKKYKWSDDSFIIVQTGGDMVFQLGT